MLYRRNRKIQRITTCIDNKHNVKIHKSRTKISHTHKKVRTAHIAYTYKIKYKIINSQIINIHKIVHFETRKKLKYINTKVERIYT